ncbi:MAG: ATP-binding domain-containing protein, partial [Deltaproteobacteria bacterium]|nr:ATP-binding domain-containing protein [Deltaproteobacteria bacterium]
NVLKDIIDSGAVTVVELNEIFRQARESRIIVNAHLINSGRFPSVPKSKDELEDFYFIEKEDPEAVLQQVLELVGKRIPASFGVDAIDDIQVLTPMHRGVVGTVNLNTELQKLLNPHKDGLTRGSRTFMPEDKVMQIRNNYDKEVFNGDIGRITRIDTEARQVTIIFDGRQVAYDFNELEEVAHAYAVSVHKSQGSEFPVVIMPVVTQHFMLLQRNLLYTGVTRGKKLVVLVGSKKALTIAVKNDKTRKRYTSLQWRLK